MNRAAAQSNAEDHIDRARAKFVSILLCEGATEAAKLDGDAPPLDRVPALVGKARQRLLAAARCCTDPEAAKELRHIAQRCSWILADFRRDLRRQAHGW